MFIDLMVQADIDIHGFKSIQYVSSKDVQSCSFYLWGPKNNSGQR